MTERKYLFEKPLERNGYYVMHINSLFRHYCHISNCEIQGYANDRGFTEHLKDRGITMRKMRDPNYYHFTIQSHQDGSGV